MPRLKHVKPTIDVPGLHEALDQRRREDGLNWAKTAARVGYGSPNLGRRLKAGETPSLHVFGAIMLYLEETSLVPYLLEPPRRSRRLISVPADDFAHMKRAVNRMAIASVQLS